MRAQNRSGALAQFAALLADDDGTVAGETGDECFDCREGMTERAWNQVGVSFEVFVYAHVDDDRSCRGADKAAELWNGDFSWRRHGASS